MSTIKFATWSGTCPFCDCAYPKGARIARSPFGWGHETCIAEWRGRRTGLSLTASGRR
jgi:hypothetical protein